MPPDSRRSGGVGDGSVPHGRVRAKERITAAEPWGCRLCSGELPRSLTSVRACLAALLILIGLLEAASAHQLNLSTLYATVTGEKVTVDLGIFGSDAAKMAGRPLVDPGSGLVDPDKLDAPAADLERYSAQHLAIAGKNGVASVQGPPLLRPDLEGGPPPEPSLPSPKPPAR